MRKADIRALANTYAHAPHAPHAPHAAIALEPRTEKRNTPKSGTHRKAEHTEKRNTREMYGISYILYVE
jgi:hypothetical protein